MYDAVMNRYSIASFEAFLSTWNRAQCYLALDAMFWNTPNKERDKYGAAPIDSDLSAVRAADLPRLLGLA